jgi:hypothetical protein
MYAQLLFDGSDLIDCLVKTLFTKEAVLLLLKLLTEFLESLGRDNLVQVRQQNRVFTSLVWTAR